MLAMVVNNNAGNMTPRDAFRSSRLLQKKRRPMGRRFSEHQATGLIGFSGYQTSISGLTVSFGQFTAAFQPGFNSSTLLFGHRATLLQAYQTEVVAANIAQTVGFHGFFEECVEESVNGFFSSGLR